MEITYGILTLHSCVLLFVCCCVRERESIRDNVVAIRCWKLKCGGVTTLLVYMHI